MTNREYYKEQILDIACAGHNFGVRKTPIEIVDCNSLKCTKCKFYNQISCKQMLEKWCNSEYSELPKLTKNEKIFLDILSSKWQYIARDNNGDLFIYETKPKKEYADYEYTATFWDSTGDYLNITLSEKMFQDVLFPFIKWKDRKPWEISKLKQLEVEE